MSDNVGMSIAVTGMALGGVGALTMHECIKKGQALDALNAIQVRAALADTPPDVIRHRGGGEVDVTKEFSAIAGELGSQGRTGPPLLLKGFIGVAVGSMLLGAGIIGASLLRGDDLP